LSIVESQNDQKDIETPGVSRKIPFQDRINESIAKDLDLRNYQSF